MMDMTSDPDAGACRGCRCQSGTSQDTLSLAWLPAHIQATSFNHRMDLLLRQHLMSKVHMHRRLGVRPMLPFAYAAIKTSVCLFVHSAFKTQCRAAPVQQRVHAPQAARPHEAAQRGAQRRRVRGRGAFSRLSAIAIDVSARLSRGGECGLQCAHGRIALAAIQRRDVQLQTSHQLEHEPYKATLRHSFSANTSTDDCGK